MSVKKIIEKITQSSSEEDSKYLSSLEESFSADESNEEAVRKLVQLIEKKYEKDKKD